MLKSDYALFIGAEKESYHTEFVVSDTLFLVYSSNEGTESTTALKQLLKQAQEEIEKKQPVNLADFESLIDTLVIHKTKHENSSIAAGLLVDSVLYLKTFGEGEVMLRRGPKLGKIISNNLSASGHVMTGDVVIFTNTTFLNLIDTTTLSEKMNEATPKEVIDTITPVVKTADDAGAIALFVHFGRETAEETIIEETVSQEEIAGDSYDDMPVRDSHDDIKSNTPNFFTSLKNKLSTSISTLSQMQQGSSKNKKLTLVAVVIIFIILVWSVGFGIQRRNSAELKKDIQHSQEIIDQKIQEATDVSGLNVERSQILLSEAQTTFETIKKKAGKNETEAIQKMGDKLAQAQNSIVKKEDKKAEVFYDLKLINSNAAADYMYKDKTAVLLLNGEKKEAYVLDLVKKSVKTYKKDELQGATIGAIYNDDVIFYVPTKGMYKIDKDNKVTQVIQNDSEWGTITDMAIYNGNLYVLDSGKSDVYKYLVAENGYSEKKSYFKDGQKITITGTATLAIDSALYLATEKKAYKFMTGVRDTFDVQFPDSGQHVFTHIITDKTTSNVYILDKTNSKVYILSKTGQYEKQIESKIFKEADAVTVLDNTKSIYVLVGDKIYSVAL